MQYDSQLFVLASTVFSDDMHLTSPFSLLSACMHLAGIVLENRLVIWCTVKVKHIQEMTK